MPETKTVYQTGTDGIFVGIIILSAATGDVSPRSGEWLIPGGATEISPPEIPEGHRAYFDFVTQTWNLQLIPVEPEPEPPTFEELKEQKLAEIVTARTAAERQSITYLGKIFATDSDTLIRMTIAAQSARNAILAGEEWTIPWVEGSTATTFTASEFLGLFDAITERNNRIFEISRELKERTEAATSQEDLDAIQPEIAFNFEQQEK